MNGYKLTKQQAENIRGKEFAKGQQFNPIPGINGDYYILKGEIDNCTNEIYMWVKNLIPSEHVPPINNNTP